ncbi:nucleoside 2-deoxyribosyltransferase [Amphibacillus sp. MSJ-3]|uniref:nucleoside 2-deoxyribosyltransferase n=1 Tax=Amphibacillus sp. MSJ-3 TaxID=2841505 RepID=UPI001C0E96F9|nr:nucleoside 2-deoxyribosyltransferase [Amphibacillus sp. MSJ-3]MBU5594125.1 nucleoside 2-deoxyribosyltransferase [Amphibacillus sp. MSJ-3]
MKGYLANGLFTIGDRIVNDLISEQIRRDFKDIKLYVPQENDDINNKDAFADSLMIFEADKKELMASDFLIAVIDGVEIDSGVAAELGMFATTGKPIFALYSDVRQQGRENRKKISALIADGTENQFAYRNLFVIGLIKKSGGGIFSEIEDLSKAIADFLD